MGGGSGVGLKVSVRLLVPVGFTGVKTGDAVIVSVTPVLSVGEGGGVNVSEGVLLGIGEGV